MAPTRSKKQRKSTESATSVDVQNFPAPPQLVPTKIRSPTRTPTNRSPIRKQKMGITVGQKQALIDNLQLEITERARKLRAQYMILAQGLRARVEIRVNRIPMALRKAKMGDLFEKHSEKASKAIAGPSRTAAEKINSPAKNLIQEGQSHHARASPSPQRGHKRTSDEISVDKENEDIENPKKRPRAAAPIPPARTTSRAPIKPSQVLSPRSANSRTLPRSPIRPASPAKSFLSRPLSPVKPAPPAPHGGAAGILTNMVEKAKQTRSAATRKATETATTMKAGVGRGRRPAAAAAVPASAPKVGRGRASDSSHTSDSSNSTVVKKHVGGTVAAKKAAPVKKTVMSTIKGMSSQRKAAPAPKKTTTASTATTGGRVLRKRN